MTIKALPIFLAAFLALGAAQAQHSAAYYLPSGVDVVMAYHPEALDKAVPLAELSGSPAYQRFLELLRQEIGTEGPDAWANDLFAQPERFGFNAAAPHYFFMDYGDQVTSYGVVLSCSDAGRFGEFFRTKMNSAGEFVVTQAQGRNVARGSDSSAPIIMWDNTAIVGLFTEYQYGNFNFWDPAQAEPDQEAIARQCQERNEALLQSAFGNAALKKASGNERFIATQRKPGHLQLWANYKSLMDSPMQQGALGLYAGLVPGLDAFLGDLYALYDDTYLALDLDFKAGSIEMGSTMSYNARLSELMEEGADADFNKDFLPYVDASNLIGIYHFHFDFEDVVEGSKALFFPIIEKVEKGDVAVAAWQVLDLLVDREQIYDMWDGDLLIAFTGMKPMSVTYDTYEYDEDFNATKITKTETQNLPELVLLFSYEDQSAIDKVLRLATLSGDIEKKGAYYSMAERPAELPVGLYMSARDGVFALSNNEELVQKGLAGGVAKAKQMPKALRKALCDNNQVLYLDFAKGSRLLLDFPLLPAELRPALEESGSTLRDMMFSSKVKGKVATSEMRLNFADGQRNALLQIMDFLERSLQDANGERGM